MDSDIKNLLKEIKEIDGDKLDRLVAEKIFGFQVRTRTGMFNEYTQVNGRCGGALVSDGNDGFWREDELKRYPLAYPICEGSRGENRTFSKIYRKRQTLSIGGCIF